MPAITLDRMELGMDRRKGRGVSDANRLYELKNAFISGGWVPQTRPGLTKITSTPLSTGPALAPPQSSSPIEGDRPVIDAPSGQIPAVLPILPLRGLVVYPETAVPLTIGQPRSIRLVDDVLQLAIQDDGVGIDNTQARPTSHGLEIMRERAEAVGGSMKVGMGSPKGTLVEARIPIQTGQAIKEMKELNKPWT